MQRRGGIALLVAVLLVVQLVCWRGSARLRTTSSFLQPRFPLSAPSLALDPNSSYPTNARHSKKPKAPKTTETTSATKTTLSPSHSHSSTSSTPLPSNSGTGTPCQPLPFTISAPDLCEHVRLYCPPSGHLDYLQFYYCAGFSDPLPTTAPSLQQDNGMHEAKKTQPLPDQPAPLPAHLAFLRGSALACIIAWMLFLFSWVGVVASDFFCPNLGTIAARLGLSESTAGVTFLAFGNGSPDVFSTFGAMRTGSGSLAIGELIGAASFIVSVISGSMMLIAPFRVKPFPFIRDVGFFTIAVATTMAFLLDGKLRFNECLGMIALYLAYAATVILGSWWQERQRRKKMLMAGIRDDYSAGSVASREASTGADMERQTSQHLAVSPAPSVHISPNEYDPDVNPFANWPQPSAGDHSGGASPQHSPLLTGYDLPTSSSNYSNTTFQRRPIAGARHSLLGAVEFRDVVRSLQQEALADRSVEIFQSRDPERFLPHHHRHQHHQRPESTDPQWLHPQRSLSQRGHARVRSLGPVSSQQALPKQRSNSVESSSGQKPELFRSRSTIGVGSGKGTSSGVECSGSQEWSITRQSQPSAFDARAVEAAVGDPWKEHSSSDGCEHTMLPPPARPLDSEPRETASHKPRLREQTDSNSSNSSQLDSEDDSEERGREEGSGKRRRERSRSGDAKDQSRWEIAREAISPILKVLFPSLRHFHEKSWLGVIVGLITAPAIMVLNLSLPVVDDEAEREALSGGKAAREAALGADVFNGQVRLEGPEGDLYASTRRQDGNNDGDEDGEHIINLSTATPPSNPWSASDMEGQDNRRSHLKVASALRRLPQDASPLLAASPSSMHSPRRLDVISSPSRYQKSPNNMTDEVDSDSGSCDSQDSHVFNTQSSHLFLVIAQCVFAPPFIVWAISSSANSPRIGLKTSFALLAGIAIALVALFTTFRLRRQASHDQISAPPSMGLSMAVGWARVAVGFVVSILYIMTIVDEVVSILQTLGIILGLSDAILGLTVFAMGNSLGDLVANVTIAKMGHPVMAISACFAGPLLNLLLGIGISGTWLLSGDRIHSIPNQPGPGAHISSMNNPLVRHRHQDGIYQIDFSPTLLVSGVGLLVILSGTLIAVPLNGFYLNRTIGLTLIVTYAVIMTVNVLVEVYYLQ